MLTPSAFPGHPSEVIDGGSQGLVRGALGLWRAVCKLALSLGIL